MSTTGQKESCQDYRLQYLKHRLGKIKAELSDTLDEIESEASVESAFQAGNLAGREETLGVVISILETM